jgi:hypothetical protein
MNAPPESLNSKRPLAIGILLLTLLAFGLRIFRLSNQSFWIDEVSSVMAAQGPLKGIYERSVLAANSLPTFFLMLKPFVTAPGADIEIRARLLSVIAGTLAVPVFIGVVYLWRRKRKAALLAGALLAVNPLHLWYSQEVRGYAVMLLFGLAALFCFELARERKRTVWWVLYFLNAIMAIAVHRTGIIFPAACGLWHLAEVWKKRDSWKWLLGHAPVFVAILVALSLKSYPPAEGYSRSASGLEIGYTFLTFVGGYSFGPPVTDIQSLGPLGAISRHPIQTGISVVVLASLGLAFILNFRRLISGREIQLLLFSVGVVSVYALISGFPYNVRYVLPGLLGLLALAAVLGGESPKACFARATVTGLFIVSLWADNQWFYARDYRKDDSRAVADWLVEHRDTVHSWEILPSYMNTPVEWYLQRAPDVLAREMHSTGDRSTSFPPVPDVFILTRRHHLQGPDNMISAYQTAAHGMETNREFAGFELYVRAKEGVR